MYVVSVDVSTICLGCWVLTTFIGQIPLQYQNIIYINCTINIFNENNINIKHQILNECINYLKCKILVE